MKERPILFSAPMVRAILRGDKTQTRRIMARWPSNSAVHAKAGTGYNFMPVPDQAGYWKPIGPIWAVREAMGVDLLPIVKCPYGVPGDRLWVRETWAACPRAGGHILHRADDEDLGTCHVKGWKSAMCMPRSASRITLEITDVRVEPLQDITFAGAAREGVGLSIENFKHLWGTINGPESWEANPYVWVISFQRVEG